MASMGLFFTLMKPHTSNAAAMVSTTYRFFNDQLINDEIIVVD
jgi:hypothetical protein